MNIMNSRKTQKVLNKFWQSGDNLGKEIIHIDDEKDLINDLLALYGVINWVAVSDSLPDHLENVIMYGKRTEHNEPEIITGELNKAGGLNEWNSCGIIMYEVTHWVKINAPCL